MVLGYPTESSVSELIYTFLASMGSIGLVLSWLWVLLNIILTFIFSTYYFLGKQEKNAYQLIAINVLMTFPVGLCLLLAYLLLYFVIGFGAIFLSLKIFGS